MNTERSAMAETRDILLKRLETEALKIRRNVWRALHAAGSGHVGGSASAADIRPMSTKPTRQRWRRSTLMDLCTYAWVVGPKSPR